MHGADEAQALRIHLASVLGRDFVRDLPVDAERVVAAGLGRGHAQHAEAMAARELAAGRRDRRRHRDLRMRPGVGLELARRVDQREPIGLVRDPLTLEEAQDDFDRFDHAVALGRRIDSHREGVRRQQARSDAEHEAAARLMIELEDAVRGHQGVMVRKRNHARAQHDALGALRRGGDEHFGTRDDLIAGGMVFADPGLFVAEAVEMLDQLQIALDAQRGVFVDRVKRREEDSVLELDRHCVVPSENLTALCHRRGRESPFPQRQMAGGVKPPSCSSMAAAKSNRRSSPCHGPTSCTPTGRPCSVCPAGTASAGACRAEAGDIQFSMLR